MARLTYSTGIPIVVMLVILASLLVFMCLPLGQMQGSAAGGILDLRAEDLSGSVYRLTGEWQYTIGKLYAPEAFPPGAPYIDVPNNWGGGNDNLNGCATYRLIVRTNNTGQLTLYVPEIYTAYSLYLNGEYVRSAGVVSDDPANGEPKYESVLVPAKALSGELEIVIQASNYHWMRPHMNNVLKLAENDRMNAWFFRTRGLYILAMGSILAAALYHFSLYIMRRRIIIHLLFSLLCFFCFWRLALETDGLSDFTGWFSMSSGIIDARIFIVLFFLHAAFIALFSLFVFNREWIARHIYKAIGICVLGSVAFLCLPMNVSWFPAVFTAATMPMLLFALFKALRSRLLREEKILWLYVIAIILYIVVGFASKYFADHLLYMTPVLTNTYMIMAQSLILAQQFSEAREAKLTLEEENAALDRLSRMKTELFQNINHDLKAPLTVICTDVLNAADMIDFDMDKDLIKARLAHAQSEIIRAARMVDGAMKYSLQSDNRKDMEPIDIAPLLRGGAESYRILLERHSNTLIIDVPESLPKIFGNADTLLHVLANLLSNAARYTRGGFIVIAAEVEEEQELVDSDKSQSINNSQLPSLNTQHIKVTVRDDGEGVKPEILPHIFERGVSDGGTGLGLSTCKAAIEAHNGKITVKSKYGEGTSVTVTLPVYSHENSGGGPC